MFPKRLPACHREKQREAEKIERCICRNQVSLHRFPSTSSITKGRATVAPAWPAETLSGGTKIGAVALLARPLPQPAQLLMLPCARLLRCLVPLLPSAFIKQRRKIPKCERLKQLPKICTFFTSGAQRTLLSHTGSRPVKQIQVQVKTVLAKKALADTRTTTY